MRDAIEMDLFRYTGKPFSTGRFLMALFTIPGFRFMWLSRRCRNTARFNPLGIFLRFLFRQAFVRYGYQIPFHTQIGGGLYLGHFGNIVINQQVLIGENCNIQQGVTIGISNRGARAGCPRIGDRVWIGPNSVIVGQIVVGNDVLISPLSLVNTDIPDGAVVAGNPAQIVSFAGSKGYVKNVLNDSRPGSTTIS